VRRVSQAAALAHLESASSASRRAARCSVTVRRGRWDPGATSSYLYDAKTQNLTNVTSLVDTMTWTRSAQLSVGQSPNWLLATPLSQFDNDGRILVRGTEGYSGPPHALLLVPAGLSADSISLPEPVT
jgi:hypothetical protein